ncbi:MAG TPA: BREX system P-loop protein BrxC [Clostridia bacterium]|nr:BREX system P-loop protein BrxC [Clostridia bacterium]
MLNREIYTVNPAERKIVNEGVASVNDKKLDVLQYEIETFVCDGQYEKGMEHILDTYLRNLRQEQQPAVWVSGFFGSGKSHLVKMLSAFWQDVKFPNGATARGLANLPDSVKTLLIELSSQGKRLGGLHAASGTLGSGAGGSVRLPLLRIIFKSVDLPENYSIARFVMWLKSEGIFDEVKSLVDSKGYEWNEEIDNLYVAEGLHQALSEVKPQVFPTPSSCVETLNNMYPNVADVSNDQMIKAIHDALAKNGQLPLTLVVLDEIEQYIGEDSKRAMDVQEAVEACCKQIGSKLLFIGTGQTAVTGTAFLKKLEGRFTVRIELSDADVDAVIRKVILAKKPGSLDNIRKVLDKNIGEISRHLAATPIAHNNKDSQYFTQDYPILPVRRRFWEYTLRVLDQTGTDSQLRNQLSMVHKAAQTNLNEELGSVIPADYLYFDLADKLLHARVLPRKVHEKTMSWIAQGNDEKLMARACGLIFLINKLAGSNQEIGIKATADVLADLMVDNLSAGSSTLRSKLPALLDSCELLMKVKDEYRIQTEENMAWLDEFASQKNVLQHEVHRLIAEREDRIKKKFGDVVGKISLSQGQSKVSREVYPIFDAVLPADSAERIYIWVRNGWNIEEESVRVDAKQAGNQSPTIFVFIPKRSADDIRHYLIDYKAAFATLEKKGIATTPEGKEAMASMATIRDTAEGRINELLAEAFSGAKVFQAGGNEIIESALKESILTSAKNSLQRLYPNFDMADNTGWAKVYEKAKDGSPDALKSVGFNAEPIENSVCKSILSHIGGGKKGADIRRNFEGSPFGWSGDAVDGAIQVLLVSGQLRCNDEQGKNVEPKELERKQIGKVTFKLESVTVTVLQRIQIRKLFQKVGVKAEQGKESQKVSEFIDKMTELASGAGGQAPKPTKPDTAALNEISMKAGNEQLLFIFKRNEELSKNIDQWTDLKDKIDASMPAWNSLTALLNEADNSASIQDTRAQINTIEEERLLLHEPDMVAPLLKSLEGELRKLLNQKCNDYRAAFNAFSNNLKADAAWDKLSEEKQAEIIKICGIVDIEIIVMGTYSELLAALKKYPLSSWNDRRDALKAKFEKVQELANKEVEPKIQTIDIPKRTFKKAEDIDAWLDEVGKQLKASLDNGPIVIR